MPITVQTNPPIILNLNSGLWKMKLKAVADRSSLHYGLPTAPAIALQACMDRLLAERPADLTIFVHPLGNAVAAIAAAAPIYASTPTITVVTYTPALTHLIDPPSSPKRAISLAHAIRNAHGADVFLAPEYFFNFYDAKLTPFNPEELDSLLFKLALASRTIPETLLIPGTIIWNDDQKQTRNSTFVFLNGERVESSDGRRRYDKADASYDKGFDQRHKWVGGATPHYDFQFKDVNCRVEICKDSGSSNNPAIDLQLIVSSRLGQVSSAETHPGGWSVIADGDGHSIRQQPHMINRVQVSAPITTHTIQVGIPLR